MFNHTSYLRDQAVKKLKRSKLYSQFNQKQIILYINAIGNYGQIKLK